MHKKLKTVLMILLPIFLVLTLANVSGAIIDCSMCHKTVSGKIAIKAPDTIEITDKTCLKCHNPDYPPTPIGYNTHLAHVGKYSAKVDYLSRHPKAAESISCNNCHMNIGQDCQNCHVKNIPHIPPPLGYSCKGCHGELDKLFRHPAIGLKIHDIFNIGNTTACTMCHNPDNMISLKLANGDIAPIQESYRLCFQCHSNYYNLWDSGSHYSNKTMPSDTDISISNDMDTNIQEIKSGLENKWRKENTCTNCHNPHNPKELYQLPMPISARATHIGVAEIIGSNLLYIGIILIVIIAITILIIKKKKLKLSEFKLSDLKLSKLKLSNLKFPKISIPISISLEDTSKIEEKPVTEGIKTEEFVTEGIKKEEPVTESIKKEEPVTESIKKEEPVTESIKKEEPETKPDSMSYEKDLERLIRETAPKTEERAKKTFFYKYRKDIYFLLAICIMLGSFYIIFGEFIPITVVVSESMSPHIEKGDLIFYTDISRIDKIVVYNDGKMYQSFENYGDVILYKPFGQEGVAPYIHRAMYYVNQDDEMWPDGPKAPHAGYITKGDNDFTNPKYDQQGSVSLNQPIEKEWIIGVARFRIPYIGYIRMILP